MIVKFHARGKGGGSGPVDYLLGRERNREGARVLRGAPEEGFCAHFLQKSHS
ncbi:hypothetical protein KEP75_26365 [Escherichia coli]|nr:hypothetical protein [Escherichia coli]